MGVLKVLKGTLSTLGKKNRNGRVYSKELWQNVLNSEYWNDMVSNNSLFGECVHPADNRSTSDPFEIDANNVSHRISEAHIEGDRLIGTVEILDTDAGRNIASLIDSGCNIGISARGAGDLNGDQVDPDTYQFKTFDLTFRPSDFNARLVPLTESERKKFKPIKESEETDLLIDKAQNKEGYVPGPDDAETYKSPLYNRVADMIKEVNKEVGLKDAKIYVDMLKTTSDTGNYKVTLKGYSNEGNNYSMVTLGFIDEDIPDEDLRRDTKKALKLIAPILKPVTINLSNDYIEIPLKQDTEE